MLNTNLTFQKGVLDKDTIIEKYLVWILLGIYVVVNLIFGLNEEATWDDDCPTRYYNTLNAFNDPQHFISVWNRPLFVLVFAPIVHLGKHSIFISMVIMTAIGAYYLYKGVKKMGIPNAFMIIPFLLFQTYFFSISRNAETEPISVTLLCLGVYFLTHKKWLGFAIVGGLVPLARLELSVLLIFWAYYLVKEKQYIYLLILAAPTILWNIAGGIINGDFAYVYNSTVGKENKNNRYGHTTFGHYFQRYIYVIGPVIYAFFILGLVDKIKKFKWDFFLFWQMVAGFMLYVVFSWKLNMGNAAGFLRNLIPLSPLVALFALQGYNFLWQAFSAKSSSKEEAIAFDKPAKDYDELSEDEIESLNFKKKKAYLKKVEEWEAKVAQVKKKAEQNLKREESKTTGNLIWIGLILLFLVWSTYKFHSFEILSHHKLTENPLWTNFYAMLATILIILLMFVFSKLMKRQKMVYFGFGVMISLGALAFTGITEPPNNNMSPERQTMQDVSDLYVGSYLQDKTTYVNHIWFFWANDLDKYDTTHYKLVTIDNLNAANIGDVLIYETHYSHRLAGDVPAKWFDNRKDWVELSRNISEDKRFHCTIYQKCDTTFEDGIAKLDEYISHFPDNPLTYLSKGNFYKTYNKPDLALTYYTKSIELDSTIFNVYFNRGLIYFSKKQYDSALVDFKSAFKLNPKSHDAVHNQGACFANLQQQDSAIYYYDQTIKVKPDFGAAYLNKARTLKQQGKVDEALVTLNNAISINLKDEKAILERAQIFYEKKDFVSCANDLGNAIKLNPKNPNGFFIRAICYMNQNNKDAACADWASAAALGHQQAGLYIQQYCNQAVTQ